MQRDRIRCGLACALMLALVLAGRGAAQGGDRVFDETGQRLDNRYGFLQFWESHDGAEIFGPPITGIVFEANVPVQYFERGRLEHRAGTVTPGALGRERTRWRAFTPAYPRSPRADEQVFAETGHTIAGAFLRFWREHDGAVVFGMPLSEPLWEVVGGSSVRVQYFERARLEQRLVGDGESIQVSPLGREIALAKGLVTPDQQAAVAIVDVSDTGDGQAAFAELAPPTPTPIPPTPTPVPPTRTPLPPTRTPLPATATAKQAKPVALTPTPKLASGAGPAAQEPAAAPALRSAGLRATPVPSPTLSPKSTARSAAPAEAMGKVITVNLSTQWLVATENGAVVYKAPVATGRDGFKTPTGTFDIYSKAKLRTMRGEANGETWVVPNVPNAMYINGGVALHGTYWHNKFGTGARPSHGCVNLSLADAEWLYNWAPVGTTVIVHY